MENLKELKPQLQIANSKNENFPNNSKLLFFHCDEQINQGKLILYQSECQGKNQSKMSLGTAH